MKYLAGKHYLDAKNFVGECEAVVVVVKGQGKEKHTDLRPNSCHFIS